MSKQLDGYIWSNWNTTTKRSGDIFLIQAYNKWLINGHGSLLSAARRCLPPKPWGQLLYWSNDKIHMKKKNNVLKHDLFDKVLNIPFINTAYFLTSSPLLYTLSHTFIGKKQCQQSFKREGIKVTEAGLMYIQELWFYLKEPRLQTKWCSSSGYLWI